jgi:hypothetical protein
MRLYVANQTLVHYSSKIVKQILVSEVQQMNETVQVKGLIDIVHYLIMSCHSARMCSITTE